MMHEYTDVEIGGALPFAYITLDREKDILNARAFLDALPERPQDKSEPEEPAWIPHDGGPCPLKDREVEEWQAKWISGAVDDYKELAPSYAAGWDGSIIAYRVLKWKLGFGQEAKVHQEPAKPWTPAVGDTVRLKSGGPVMTVTHVDPLSLMCAWMNADDELQVEPITTLCLEPAQP